jgi:hypothetical protein
MTEEELQRSASPAVEVEVRGKSAKLFKAAALFASGLAATAAMMGPGEHRIADVIGGMQAQGDRAQHTLQPTSSPDAKPSLASKAAPAQDLGSLLNETDKARVQILSRPVPSDTRAAAEISRAIPLPRDSKVELPSAEQTKVLSYGQFAPIAARVFNNATKQRETHWTLHPWDVARLADQASDELYKQRRIRVEPRLIAGAYYTESSGVVQIGFDRKGVEMLNKGRSIDEVVKSGSKASFGLFQIDQQHAGAADLDPVRGAKRAAELLAEGQDNVRRYPHLGMLPVSATYNASTTLRAKIFTGATMDARELEAFEGVRNHAASMSYGAALYDVAHRTYKQHLVQAQKEGMPVAVAADTFLKRVDPLKNERVDAVLALTGRGFRANEGTQEASAAAVAVAVQPCTAATANPVQSAQKPALPPADKTPAPVEAVASAPPIPAAGVVTAQSPAKAKPSLRDAIRSSNIATKRPTQPAAAAASRKSASPTPSARASDIAQNATAPQTRPGGLQVIGGPAWSQPAQLVVPERGIVVSGRGVSPERAKAALASSVSDWKSGASAMLGRVADFHQRRTREMAAEREAP